MFFLIEIELRFESCILWRAQQVTGEEPGTLHIYSHEQWSVKIDEILRCKISG